MKKKKIIVGIIIAAIVVAVAAVAIFLFNKNSGSGKDKVYVESVATVMGVDTGVANRFAGVVEAQESWEINQDTDKEVAEIYVKVGDRVSEGDKLFAYKTDDASAQIAEKQLEIESINNKINEFNAQIGLLAAERDAAAEDAKFDYTTQIQSLQNEIQQEEFNKKSEELEISKLNETIRNSVVTSKMNGVVKSVNDGSGEEDGSGAFMTIFAEGDYRIKCEVNEQHVAQLEEGMSMAVYSRVNEEDMWSGTIVSIKTDSPISGNNEYDMEEGSEMTSSSKYPFYIALDTTEGLMLGQHVYVQSSGAQSTKKGIWLYEAYVEQEDDKAYVWVDNGKGKIEKREVTLGKYSEETGEYQIKKGLEMTDYITWPMPSLYEGVQTVTDESKVDYESPMYQSEAEEE